LEFWGGGGGGRGRGMGAKRGGPRRGIWKRTKKKKKFPKRGGGGPFGHGDKVWLGPGIKI